MEEQITSERWRQVKAIFQAAIELPAAERDAYLANACASDPSLLADVESLIAAHEATGSFMDAPVFDITAGYTTRQLSTLAGQALGHYQILSLLGRGGMGEVWRALDQRLAREVAVKVLPAKFASDAELLKRFEQEARAAGMLNHPNILTIYDIGTQAGAPYIVSELLEGEELRAELNGGSLPTRKAVDYAIQTARGLAAAHEKGVVHRDLKPENLFVTRDGRVKILDFGLAKLKEKSGRVGEWGNGGAGEWEKRRAASPTPPLPHSPAPPLTSPGVVLGTVGYMSPEQARGLEADARTDIFALGAILYEMLAGRRAFQGESAIETMNAILREEPPELETTSGKIAPQLDLIVRRCLAKQPEQRFQSASDLGFALQSLSSMATSQAAVSGEQKAISHRVRRERLIWIAATALCALSLIALLPFAIAYFRSAPAASVATRSSILLPEKLVVGSIAVSPDGGHLAFTATDADGKRLLWLRPLDSLVAKSLPGTEDARYPFWSPDSHFIGFFAHDKLKKIDLVGSLVEPLCNVSGPGIRGGAWNQAGTIIFTSGAVSEPLYRVPAAGGEPTQVAALDRTSGQTAYRFPQFLPDGRRFLYYVRSSRAESRGVYVGSLDGGPPKRITDSDSQAVYAPPGWLLFMREGSLMAQQFDANTLELAGQASTVAEQLAFVRDSVEAYFSVSEGGALIYRSGGASKTRLIWMDRNGRQIGSPTPSGQYDVPRLSPDEKRVATFRFDPHSKNRDVWLFDLASGRDQRLTFDPASDLFPVWSPDGSAVVFGSDKGGRRGLYTKQASGVGDEELLWQAERGVVPFDWSADGRFILFSMSDQQTKLDLWILPLSERKPFAFLRSPSNERGGAFSPDSRWVAYVSDETGTDQVYVQSLPPSGGQWQISTSGGAVPRWRRAGREVFFQSPDNKLMAVEVKASAASFEAGAPKALFEMPPLFVNTTYRYDVSADGQRFLILTSVEESAQTPLTVVTNWTAGLKK